MLVAVGSALRRRSDAMQSSPPLLVQLLGNLLLWHGLIAEDHLLELAVDGLLNRYMLLSLQNSDVNDESILKCHRVSTF